METKEYQIEVEASDWVLGLDKSPTRDNSLEPYVDEPLVDEEWLVNYKKEKEEKDQLENDLKQHLENVVWKCYELLVLWWIKRAREDQKSCLQMKKHL